MPTQIVPRLWLGDINPTYSREALRPFTHVMSLLDDHHLTTAMLDAGVIRVSFPVRDHQNQKLPLNETTLWLQTALATPHSNVLVHCLAGISRSPTVVAAYLTVATECTAAEAIAHIKSLRPIIDPNPGFMRQLVEWSLTV